MLNRKEAPALEAINKIEFLAPEKHEYNSLPIFHMDAVPNETARIDLYFNAGKINGNKGISSFVNGLILSGTTQYSSNELNEKINALGAYFSSGISMENAVITVHCLKEHIEEVVTIIAHAIEQANFPLKEINELLNDRKQRFLINQSKVSFNVQRGFQEVLFNSDNRYAYVMQLKDFETINRDEIISFHERYYKSGLQKVVIVGNVSKESINNIASKLAPLHSEKQAHTNEIIPSASKKHIKVKNALQTAIRVGKIIFNKTHEDYHDFLILNTIIGDYFGSRLMTNIREDKGYTYGIGSAVVELQKTGYFVIVTEVGEKFKSATLKEIEFEIKRPQNELVPKEELELVKNYILGQLLKSADGPYAMTDLFMSVEQHKKDLDFYNEAIKNLNAITPERIQYLAQKYLKWEEFNIVTAG